MKKAVTRRRGGSSTVTMRIIVTGCQQWGRQVYLVDDIVVM